MRSTHPLLPLIILVLVFCGVSVTSMITARRTSRELLAHRDSLTTQLSDLQRAHSEMIADLGTLELQMRDLRAELDSLTAGLQQHEHVEPVPVAPSQDPVGSSAMPLDELIARPFLLPADLEQGILDGTKPRKMGRLLREVSDGYISVSLYDGPEELPLTVDSAAVYKEFARLAAMQVQNKIDLIQRLRSTGDYEVFESPLAAAEYVSAASAPPDGGRRYFEVLEEEGLFLVFHVSEHYTSTLYKLVTEAEAELLHGDPRITSTGTSHHRRDGN